MSTLDPEKRYRLLTDQLEVTDTIANRSALAEECLELGKFQEAERHYDHILALPLGDDAIYALGKARAQFGGGHAQEAVATLDNLREALAGLPIRGWASALCPRARRVAAIPKKRCWNITPSRTTFRVPKRACATVSCSIKPAAHAEAMAVLGEVMAQLKRAPKYVRRAQAEWIGLAEKALRAQSGT